MIKRTCPNCGKDWFSADTTAGDWKCPLCGQAIPKSAEKPPEVILAGTTRIWGEFSPGPITGNAKKQCGVDWEAIVKGIAHGKTTIARPFTDACMNDLFETAVDLARQVEASREWDAERATIEQRLCKHYGQWQTSHSTGAPQETREFYHSQIIRDIGALRAAMQARSAKWQKKQDDILGDVKIDINEIAKDLKLRAQREKASEIRILFESIPGTPDLLFVEIEDNTGRSRRIGKWNDRAYRGKNYRVLRIRAEEIQQLET